MKAQRFCGGSERGSNILCRIGARVKDFVSDRIGGQGFCVGSDRGSRVLCRIGAEILENLSGRNEDISKCVGSERGPLRMCHVGSVANKKPLGVSPLWLWNLCWTRPLANTN